MIDDDNETPPIRLPTHEERVRHFRDYKPGTPVVHEEQQMPIDEESSTEHRLTRLERAVESLSAGRAVQSKIIWFVIPALIGALGTVLVFSANRIEASAERVGETTAELRALREQSSRQETEITELRSQIWSMRKQSRLDAPLPNSGPDWPLGDKFSTLDQWLGALGVSTPASSGTLSGRVALQIPKLQNLHVGTSATLHSMFDEQRLPQLVLGLTWSGWGGAVASGRTSHATTMTNTISIPRMERMSTL